MANLFHEVKDRLEAAFGSYEPENPSPIPRPAAGGWPVEQADVFVLDPSAPLAICTLGDLDLARRLAECGPSQIALIGPMATENLGVEKVVRNVVTSPAIRVVILVGPETGGSAPTGHYAGDALLCLLENGFDPETMRIRGAKGRRPLLRNLTLNEVEIFRRRVGLVDRRGLADPDAIWSVVEQAARDLPLRTAEDVELPYVADLPPSVPVLQVGSPSRRFQKDPAGHFVLYVDHLRAQIVLEHYRTDDQRTLVMMGNDPEGIAQEVIERGLLGSLDHAIYLGRELDRAHAALTEGRAYVQDAGSTS